MPWGTAEAYGIARQSTGAYVTGGYGRSAPTRHGQRALLPLHRRGRLRHDLGDDRRIREGSDRRQRPRPQHRGVADDRVMIVGSATPAMGNVDGMIMILTANGALDTTFNTTGYKIYKFDAASDRPDESLYGAAVSPDGMFAAAAGYRNAAAPSGDHQRRRGAGDLAARRDGNRVRGGGAAVDDRQRPVLGGHLRRQQQDRRRRLRRGRNGSASWRWRASTPTAPATRRFGTTAPASPRSTPAPAPRAPSSKRRAAWSCSRTARSSSADPPSTSLSR